MNICMPSFLPTWRQRHYRYLIGEFSTKLGLEYLKIAAAGVLASLPPVILALFFQKFIIRGLTSGAVK